MSLSIEPMEVVSVVEPTLRTRERKMFAVFKGGSDNTYYSYVANSYSINQSLWNVNTPSEDMFIDRKMYIRAKLRFSFTGETPDPSQNLLQTGRDALRAFPLSNAMNTLTVQVNNGSVSINLSDVVQPLMRYASFDELYYELSGAPDYMDQSQTYEELLDSLRNPLNGYHDSIDGAFIPRGAFPMTVVSNTDTEAVVEVEICEPLMVSPLHFNRSHANGFIGVKQLALQIVWNSNVAAKMWSHAGSLAEGGSDITTAEVEFIDAPELLVRVINPSELESFEIPKQTIYPYHDIQRYVTDVPEVSA